MSRKVLSHPFSAGRTFNDVSNVETYNSFEEVYTDAVINVKKFWEFYVSYNYF